MKFQNVIYFAALFITRVEAYCNIKNDSLEESVVWITNPREDLPGEPDEIKLGRNEPMWFENIPVPAVAIARSKTLPDGMCKIQLERYLKDLQKGKLWATQMFDSSTKIPSGIIYGHVRHFGNFDECYEIDVRVPNNEDEMEIQGKYCLVDVVYTLTELQKPFSGPYKLEFDPNDSVWESIREKGDFRRVPRYILQMATCFPAACNAKDVEVALAGIYEEFGKNNNLTIKVSVEPENCQSKKETPTFSTAATIFTIMAGTIVGVVIIATIYEGFKKTETGNVEYSKSEETLLCFSARRNLQTIFEVNYKHRGLDIIHLLRFFFACLVLVGHRTKWNWMIPVHDHRLIEHLFTVPFFTILYNGTIVVDGFFALGGLVTCYGFLHQLNKTKKPQFFALFVMRYIRLTPAYAFVVFFFATVFPYFGTGPLWKPSILKESEDCATHWWTNLFYVNNYIKPEEMCMFQSWYLSVDYHAYIIGLWVTYAFWKLPRKLGYAFLGLLTFGSSAVVFYVTYVNNIQPAFISYPYLSNILHDPYYTNYYVKTHMRLTPYFIGIISGAIVYDFDSVKWRLSKVWSNTLFLILVVGMSLISQHLQFKHYDPNINPSPLHKALYASIHRGAFGASFCAFIILLQVGTGLDFHYNFMTPRWAQPLGRISYTAFLVHFFNELYDIGTIRNAQVFNFHNGFWNFVPDVVYSFFFALIISVCIEGPLRKLEKVVFSSKKTKSKNL